MKNILIYIGLLISFLFIPNISTATDNIKITSENTGRSINNEKFNNMRDTKFFNIGTTGEKGIKNLLLNIARDLRIIVFSLVTLIGIIMVIKLIFGDNTEEEQKKLKNGILWASIGIIVMQIAFSVYKVMFDKDVNANLANSFTDKIIEPFIDLLMLLASFVFIFIAIVAFYKIITANGNEDNIKKGKITIFQAIIGFIVIKFADIIVKNTFNPNCSGGSIIVYWGTNVCNNITENAKIITTLINWINSFIAIAIVILIIYAGFLIMTSAGDEEKQKKAKDIILYVGIGLLILAASYIILTFFIKPENTI